HFHAGCDLSTKYWWIVCTCGGISLYVADVPHNLWNCTERHGRRRQVWRCRTDHGYPRRVDITAVTSLDHRYGDDRKFISSCQCLFHPASYLLRGGRVVRNANLQEKSCPVTGKSFFKENNQDRNS